MNYIDSFLGTILIAAIIWGMVRGLVRQVISIIFLGLSFLAAKYYSPNFVSVTPGSDLYDFHHAVWFFVIFVLGTLIGFFVNSLLSFAISATSLTVINRLFGGISGFLKGILLCMVVVYGLRFTELSKSDTWESSFFVRVQQPISDFADKDFIQLLKEKNL